MRVLGLVGLALFIGVGLWLFTNTGGCPAALLSGTLIESPPGELSIRSEPEDVVYSIRWGLGYGTRRLDNSRLAVVDLFGFGGPKAVAGDKVDLPGGQDTETDDGWAVCSKFGLMDHLVR